MSGKRAANGRRILTVAAAGASAGSHFAGIKAVANLPPGRRHSRVGAIGRAQSPRRALGDVVVPTSKDPIGVGRVCRRDRDGRRGDGRSVIAAAAVTPTTDRLHAGVAHRRATGFNSQKPPAPVNVKVTILDAKDKPVFEATERVEAAPFATAGFADYRFVLPLSKLGPGQFLLRLEASRSGAPAVKREVRFGTR
jgi:hypothetical protein